MTGDGGGMWFGGGYMWFFWLLIPLVIFWAFKTMSDGSGSKSDSSNASETPIDILKKRYANGEIGKDEYNERLKELENR